MSQGPLVSILTPAYKPDYFQAALDSALTQTYPNIEIIVCDDSHCSRIEDICRAAQAKGARLHYERNGERLGEIENLNRCLSLASGEYVKFLYDDDLLMPDCVETFARVLSDQPQVALISSRRRMIDESGSLLPDNVLSRFPFEVDVRLAGVDVVSLLGDFTVNFIGEPSSVMCRRAALQALPGGLFCLGGRQIEWVGDLAMYVGLLQQGDLALLGRPLSRFRISAQQYSAAARGQRGLGLLWHETFRSLVRQLACYRGPENSRMVRASSLHTPGEAQAIDLVERYIGSENAHFVDNWLRGRVPAPAEASSIARQLASSPEEERRFLVVINDFGPDRSLVEATLESLLAAASLGVAFQVVILCRDEPFAGRTDALKVSWVLAQSGETAELLNALLLELDFDWLLLVEAGEEFTYAGLALASLNLVGAPACRAFFMDEVYVAAGQPSLGLRPDFNLDLLLSMPEMSARHWLFARSALAEAGGFERRWGEVAEFDAALRLIEHGGLAGLGHIAEVLCTGSIPRSSADEAHRRRVEQHLRLRGYTEAEVSPGPRGGLRIRYGHAERPLVSIIIPTKDQLPLLQRCVETLLEKTAYQHYEVLIVDNNSETPDARQWLAGLCALGDPKVRVLRYPHPFNYSAINNLAAWESQGDYLVLLNNDTAIIRDDWLDQLLNHALRPEVGIVGAKLLYPDGAIQHAGVVLGLRGPAEHPFIGDPMDATGYLNRLQVDQNYSAVTAACLMIRKSIYEEVGGLDEEGFKVSYNDVDLCLKVVSAGHLIVWTPYSLLLHEGSASQRNIDTASHATKSERFLREQDAMYAKWLPLLATDPAYNRNLSLSGKGFAVEPDLSLTWRPLVWRPQPVVLAHPADRWGCGHYRMIKPFEAMREHKLIDGALSDGLLQVVDLERFDPDVIVLQRQIGDERLEAMRRIKAFSRAFKVYELDDYLPNLPLKNAHRGQMPKDVIRSLRRGLSFVDRFVVSTEALAEALADMHADILVVENKLPTDWWSDLRSLRRAGRKPRVGWAGGVSHTGDLQLIADVVKELANEVEWVFMGMCPDDLRPYVHEFYQGVDLDQYPNKLASLNLDLAIAPLEENLFNECKSNLRLLEYGACGYPVICSDVRCYQNDLPVHRVRNRFKDWVNAIRLHINDLDEAEAKGQRLREKILSDCMLDEPHAERWKAAWCGR